MPALWRVWAFPLVRGSPQGEWQVFVGGSFWFLQHWFSKCGSGLWASASPEHLLGMQILKQHPRRWTGTLELRPSNLCFTKPSKWLSCHSSVWATGLGRSSQPEAVLFPRVQLSTSADIIGCHNLEKESTTGWWIRLGILWNTLRRRGQPHNKDLNCLKCQQHQGWEILV